MVFEYFNRMLSSRNPILKVDNCDLIIYPSQNGRKAGVGFRGITNCQAGNLKGRIEIRAVFAIPEGEEIIIAANDEKLNQIIDSLEFIKMTDKVNNFGSVEMVLEQSDDEPV